jgi:hypothetical protein
MKWLIMIRDRGIVSDQRFRSCIEKIQLNKQNERKDINKEEDLDCLIVSTRLFYIQDWGVGICDNSVTFDEYAKEGAFGNSTLFSFGVSSSGKLKKITNSGYHKTGDTKVGGTIFSLLSPLQLRLI